MRGIDFFEALQNPFVAFRVGGHERAIAVRFDGRYNLISDDGVTINSDTFAEIFEHLSDWEREYSGLSEEILPFTMRIEKAMRIMPKQLLSLAYERYREVLGRYPDCAEALAVALEASAERSEGSFFLGPNVVDVQVAVSSCPNPVELVRGYSEHEPEDVYATVNDTRLEDRWGVIYFECEVKHPFVDCMIDRFLVPPASRRTEKFSQTCTSIINRANRLKLLKKMDPPEVILFEERRLLAECVVFSFHEMFVPENVSQHGMLAPFTLLPSRFPPPKETSLLSIHEGYFIQTPTLMAYVDFDCNLIKTFPPHGGKAGFGNERFVIFEAIPQISSAGLSNVHVLDLDCGTWLDHWPQKVSGFPYFMARFCFSTKSGTAFIASPLELETMVLPTNGKQVTRDETTFWLRSETSEYIAANGCSELSDCVGVFDLQTPETILEPYETSKVLKFLGHDGEVFGLKIPDGTRSVFRPGFREAELLLADSIVHVELVLDDEYLLRISRKALPELLHAD